MSVSARSYTNRNKYHHLWYSNVIIQTSLSSEGKANERKQARTELTACNVNNATLFSATLSTTKNERAAARDMLIECSTDVDSVCHRYFTTRRFLKGQSVNYLKVF
jgi:ribosomal protein L31